MAFGVRTDGTPTDGRNPWIDSLVWGAHWASDTGAQTVRISYVFRDGPSDWVRGAAQWSATEKQAIRKAQKQFENVAEIEFAETASLSPDIEYWVASGGNFNPGVLATHQVPYTHAEPIFGEFNYMGAGWSPSGLRPGGLGFETVVHEIGHSLGLAHPHDGGSHGDATRFPGVFGSAETGRFQLNQGVFTAMSYNAPWERKSVAPESSGHVAGPMALDIHALQLIYGPNMDHATGGNTYALPDSNGPGTFWRSIWDAGGVDRISNAASQKSAVIDLRPAELSGPHAGGHISHVAGVHGGFTVANGVEIEIAVGGRAADRLVGNDLPNTLSGGGGGDVLRGGDGADRLKGGAGRDTLWGGTGNDLISGGPGGDRMKGGKGADTATYATADRGVRVDLMTSERGLGEASDDRLKSIENVIGTKYVDQLFGHRGGNSMDGGSGPDRLFGRQGNDTLNGGRGQDLLAGGNGQDNLFGRAGADNLIGGPGNDSLSGGSGRDRLDGQRGNDDLAGGGGRDVFVFSAGHDRVRDFSTDGATDGSQDRIDLRAVAGISSVGDLRINHLSQAGNHAVIDDGRGNTMTLENVQITALDADNFLF